MEAGAFALTGVGALPNVDVAFPGEHWSDRVASGSITPGEAIVPAGSADARGHMVMRTAEAGDAAGRVALALRPVDHPDPTGVLGPNEIRNQAIASGEYVHAYYSGGFHLTLVVPDDYVPGELVGWDANGARPTGKDGTGAWAKDASADIDGIFEVILWRPVTDDGEGILTVRYANRSQM
jgi:hypothetical protein